MLGMLISSLGRSGGVGLVKKSPPLMTQFFWILEQDIAYFMSITRSLPCVLFTRTCVQPNAENLSSLGMDPSMVTFHDRSKRNSKKCTQGDEV